MKSSAVFLEIIHFARYIIFSDYYLRRATKRQMDFTRMRKMSFTDYILAIIKGRKTSLQSSIYSFFQEEHNKKVEYSKQAFSRGRQRIKPAAFLELFQATVDKFYEKAETVTWRGYHLLGIDGTRLNLPCTNELRELYGEQTSQGPSQVQALVSCLYDLLNGMIVDVRFEPCKSSERVAAQDMIESFDADRIKNPVFIMDRGYPSARLIDSVIRSGHKFIMRCPTEFLRGMKLPKQDNLLNHKFVYLKYPVKVRVVKIQLSRNKTEYLITNLYDSDISLDDFRYLYRQRWGIETKYDDIKSKLEIENFTGYTPDAILQDFYASLFLANLAGALEFDLHEEIEAAHSDPENRYKYRMNRNIVVSELKRTVVEMLVTRSKIKKARLFYTMKSRLMRAVVPVRPNREYPRERKHKASRYSQNLKRP